MPLVRLIVAGDARAVTKHLDAQPSLVTAPFKLGATRGNPTDYFFDAIRHYVYEGDTALHMAAAAMQPKIVRDLLKRKADPRAVNRRGASPLHYAVDGGPCSAHWTDGAQASIIEALLDAGADLAAVDKGGVTALHRAVRNRTSPGVAALLSRGASATAPNKSGSRPLHLAVQSTGKSGSGSAGAQAEQRRIIELLLAHGASWKDRDAKGQPVTQLIQSDWIRALVDYLPR